MSDRTPDPLFLQVGEQIRRANAERAVEIAQSIADGIVFVWRALEKASAKAGQIWSSRTPVRLRTPEALPDR